QPPWYVFLLGWRRERDAALQRATLRNQQHQQCENTAAEGEDPPHQPLPVWRNLGRVERSCGRHPVFAPDDDGVVIEIVDRPPSGKGQQRIVIVVLYKHPLQSIVIRVLQHGAQSIDAVLAKEFGTGERAGAVSREFGKLTGGVPLTVDAARIGLHSKTR